MANTNKARGTRFESAVVGGLQWALGTRDIERRQLSGSRDRGDLTGLKINGQRLVAELKAHARFDLAGWLEEANTEAANDGALAGLVIFKKRGTADPMRQYVLMDVEALTKLIKAAEGNA